MAFWVVWTVFHEIIILLELGVRNFKLSLHHDKVIWHWSENMLLVDHLLGLTSWSRGTTVYLTSFIWNAIFLPSRSCFIKSKARIRLTENSIYLPIFTSPKGGKNNWHCSVKYLKMSCLLQNLDIISLGSTYTNFSSSSEESSPC